MPAGRILAVAGMLFAAALLFYGRDHRRTVPPPPAASQIEAPNSQVDPPMIRRAAASARRVTTSVFGHPNPIIENVRVDKTEVCRGEENFLHVDVTTADGTERDLRIALTAGNVAMMGAQETGGL